MEFSRKVKQKIADGTFREMWAEAKWMFTYIRRYRAVVCIHIVLGILGTVMSLLSSVAMKQLIDVVTGFETGAIWTAAAYMAGMMVGSVLMQAAASRIAAVINIRVQNGIQAEVYDRMLRTDWESLEQFRSGDLLNRLNGDVSSVASGGAVVAVDVKTGEPLAIASYPTYDLSTLFDGDNYETLAADESNPLFNRALMGQYSPGSTFKPCTAIAGLTEGVINTGSTITCNGIFTKYEEQGYAPRCWIYSSGATHGADNVTEAIRDSCNIFFYTVGDSMNIDTLARYAAAFGLGESTGIELPESIGQMATKKLKEEKYNEDWYLGDSLQAAIGQSISLFTPLQLAEYCATIANGGTRHSASILKSVRSYDYTEQLYEAEHEVLSTVETSDYNWAAVQRGMYLVANDPRGSAYETFGTYQVPVAAKTGTAQLGENQVNNAIFICYAPYDDPQIAVAVVVEHGVAGASIASIARDVLDAYFTVKNVNASVETELSLLP